MNVPLEHIGVLLMLDLVIVNLAHRLLERDQFILEVLVFLVLLNKLKTLGFTLEDHFMHILPDVLELTYYLKEVSSIYFQDIAVTSGFV